MQIVVQTYDLFHVDVNVVDQIIGSVVGVFSLTFREVKIKLLMSAVAQLRSKAEMSGLHESSLAPALSYRLRATMPFGQTTSLLSK